MCCTISTGSNKGAIKLGVCWLRLGLAPCNPRSDTTTWWSTSLPATQSLISIPVQTAGRRVCCVHLWSDVDGRECRERLTTEYWLPRSPGESSLSLSTVTLHITQRELHFLRPPPSALNQSTDLYVLIFVYFIWHTTTTITTLPCLYILRSFSQAARCSPLKSQPRCYIWPSVNRAWFQESGTIQHKEGHSRGLIATLSDGNAPWCVECEEMYTLSLPSAQVRHKSRPGRRMFPFIKLELSQKPSPLHGRIISLNSTEDIQQR